MKDILVRVRGTKIDDTRPDDEEAQQTLILEGDGDVPHDDLRIRVTVKGSLDSVKAFSEEAKAGHKGKTLLLRIGEDPRQSRLPSFTDEEAAKT